MNFRQSQQFPSKVDLLLTDEVGEAMLGSFSADYTKYYDIELVKQENCMRSKDY